MQQKIALLLIGFLILIGIITRFIWLDKFPVGLNHDEADVVMSAKSYWQNGTDISGVKFPLSLIQTKTEAGLSGLPSFLLAPFIGPFPTNLTSARLPFAFVNILTGILISGLIWQATKKMVLSLIVFAIFLLNPWSFLYSRAATEAPFALLFTLAGVYTLMVTGGKKLFYSLPFFILAFMSYFGGKPILIILVPLILGAHFIYKKSVKKDLKIYLVYLFLFFIVVGSYFLLAAKLPGSTYKNRSAEITITNIDRFGPLVQDQRKMSVQSQASNLFINKDAFLLNELVTKYIGWTSPDYLFFKGDPRSTYTLGSHGVIYLIDAIFILIALLSLLKLSKDHNFIKSFLLISFIVAPIGASLSRVETSYFFRAFLLIPMIIILVALGINYLYETIPQKTRNLFLAAVTVIYILAFANFMNFYFFEYPVTQQENHYLSERILTSYLQRTGGEALLINESLVQISQQYMFFTNNLSQPKLNFSDDCIDATSSGKIVIVGNNSRCNNLPSSPKLIQNQKDAGTIIRIFNDTLCKDFTLTKYRRDNLVSDYAVENLTNQEFCNRWVAYE
jgi:hypothetical protein